MRTRPLVLLLLTGCLGGQLDANLRPAAQPKLSELPLESGKRDAILTQAGTTPGPETPRQQLPPKWRRIETGAAFVAAILGVAASKTSNVTLGIAITTDPETDAPPRPPAPLPAPPAPPAPINPTTLVPWVPVPGSLPSP